MILDFFEVLVLQFLGKSTPVCKSTKKFGPSPLDQDLDLIHCLLSADGSSFEAVHSKPKSSFNGLKLLNLLSPQ